MQENKKPFLSTELQIQHLLSKGVKFERVSIEDAEHYLRENNNYFKLRAYRKNFPKHPSGAKEGQYINLDFAMLQDLAIIDMRLRYILVRMALDIEHFVKVKLLQAAETFQSDGYSEVEDYFAQLKERDAQKGTRHGASLQDELSRNKENPYCGGIIKKYDGGYPIWAFIEVISFGTLVHFYKFCEERYGRKDMIDDYYLLMSVRTLRNAAAHSNCILHDMGAKDASFRTNHQVLTALGKCLRNQHEIAV